MAVALAHGVHYITHKWTPAERGADVRAVASAPAETPGMSAPEVPVRYDSEEPLRTGLRVVALDTAAPAATGISASVRPETIRTTTSIPPLGPARFDSESPQQTGERDDRVNGSASAGGNAMGIEVLPAAINVFGSPVTLEGTVPSTPDLGNLSDSL